jgi:hypothetical protein
MLCPFQYASGIFVLGFHVDADGATSIWKKEVNRPMIITRYRACGT